ncbi:MAG: hypothetical protein LBF16_00955 [Pseudomonadales bacterium]|jgi:hypothetical protein|nr:hypothetical protein [Pseudomonadales bacterium]
MRPPLLVLAALFLNACQTSALSGEATLGGHPNFNGVWQAMNSANWNLEAHSATSLDAFWPLGAIAAIPAGASMVQGGTIPYHPAALQQRDENRNHWPAADNEAKCYMLGVPRVTYHDLPFQIFQSIDDDLLMVYPFAATNRVIHMDDYQELPIDAWMGRSSGTWEGKVLVIKTVNQNGEAWLDRAGNHASNQLVVTERFQLLDADHLWYEATLEDPQTYTEPWIIAMPLYRHVEPHAQLLEHKCVPFAEKLLYQDLLGLRQ